ncbi:MAG: hypothetical protein IT350_16135 [Deltaproteobacteria bacterium]|nr:hypothetical protein [Deltaproteobacteria bacterium]
MNPISKIIAALFALIIGAYPVCAGAQISEEPTPESADDVTLQKRRQQAQLLQNEITRLRALPTPDWREVAGLYHAVFALFPQDQMGKLAVWESYLSCLKAGDPTSALAALRLIYKSYRHDSVVDHPFGYEGGKPIHMHATADVEQAMLYSRYFQSPEAAIGQLRSLPSRRPGAYVGLVSEKDTYYGQVGAIVLLKMAEAQSVSGLYNDAIMSLRLALGEFRGDHVGSAAGLLPIDAAVMERLGIVLDEMPASLAKKLAELEEALRLSTSQLALAEGRFIRAKLHEKNFREFGSQDDIALAERDYREIVERFGDLPIRTTRGGEAAGPRAVVRVVDLYTKTSKQFDKIVLILSDMETVAKERGDRPATQAYARLHRAAIYLDRLDNPRQTISILDGFDRDFPTVPVYPDNENTKKMLFEAATSLMQKAQTAARQSPSP